jgi:hypothetical protein
MAANTEVRLSVREHLNITQSSNDNDCTTTRTLQDHVNVQLGRYVLTFRRKMQPLSSGYYCILKI